MIADHADTPAKPLSPINFLHPLLPQISLTNVTNVEIEPYKKDSQMVRAVMGELISVFKDIAQLQPIFREQSESTYTLSDGNRETHLICSYQLHHV